MPPKTRKPAAPVKSLTAAERRARNAPAELPELQCAAEECEATFSPPPTPGWRKVPGQGWLCSVHARTLDLREAEEELDDALENIRVLERHLKKQLGHDRQEVGMLILNASQFGAAEERIKWIKELMAKDMQRLRRRRGLRR